MMKDRDFQDYMHAISSTHARDVLIEKIAAVFYCMPVLSVFSNREF